MYDAHVHTIAVHGALHHNKPLVTEPGNSCAISTPLGAHRERYSVENFRHQMGIEPTRQVAAAIAKRCALPSVLRPSDK